MAFKDKLKKILDAQRLQQSVRATVQQNGRLTFSTPASTVMGLSENKSLVIFEAEDGDLGAVISIKGDPDAFVLKRCGKYFYVAFKNYLKQAGIDYKSQRLIYDITELDEKIGEKTLYQFARRVLPKSPEPLPLTDGSNGAGNGDGTSDGSGAGAGKGNGDGTGGGDDDPELDDVHPQQEEIPGISEILAASDQGSVPSPNPPRIPMPTRAAAPRPPELPPTPRAPQRPRRPAPPPAEAQTSTTADLEDMPF